MKSIRNKLSLASPLASVSGVGTQTAEKLRKIGLQTLNDCLYHLPYRYQDRTRISAIGSLRAGTEALIVGRVEHVEIVLRKRRMLLAVIHDGTGALTLRLFYFQNRLQETLKPGTRICCFGETRAGPRLIEMVHPQWSLLADNDKFTPQETLSPIYPASDGISQNLLQKLCKTALDSLPGAEDSLKGCIEFGENTEFSSAIAALAYLHAPPSDARHAELASGLHPAQRRLAFEELTAHQLSLLKLKRTIKAASAHAIKSTGELGRKLIQGVGFSLTKAQTRVIHEIHADIGRKQPMLRLLQGDVGSGKTLVAAAASLRVVEAGFQVAIMAPTELLAEQHFRTLSAWMDPLKVTTALMIGSATASRRRALEKAISEGDIDIVIGTHALIQKTVQFARLALIIIDEQHRFGVYQRLALQAQGPTNRMQAHQLIMTATPIPRTLAMTAYANLDHSVIDELPPGRKPIKTVAISDRRRDEVIERVRNACRAGNQSYWVCTLIEESEVLQCEAAEARFVALRAELQELRVGLVHGRMKSDLRTEAMNAFRAGEIDLLVATTVIEVGVDVPNSNLMIIENSERLGLAQLHQLRGRIGRGQESGYCVLLYRTPLSALAKERLNAMRQTTDGFEIAKVDLRLRGPGEILGTRQSGMMNLRVADIQRDQDLLPDVRRVAREIMASRQECVDPLIARWIPDGLSYAQA